MHSIDRDNSLALALADLSPPLADAGAANGAAARADVFDAAAATAPSAVGFNLRSTESS